MGKSLCRWMGTWYLLGVCWVCDQLFCPQLEEQPSLTVYLIRTDLRLVVLSKHVIRDLCLLLLMVLQQLSVSKRHKLVDKGMIIGVHQRPGDLEVNICKTKALNNIRSATKEMTTGVIAPIEMSLDSCVEYLAADEILEVTPTTFRMSKNPDMMKQGRA